MARTSVAQRRTSGRSGHHVSWVESEGPRRAKISDVRTTAVGPGGGGLFCRGAESAVSRAHRGQFSSASANAHRFVRRRPPRRALARFQPVSWKSPARKACVQASCSSSARAAVEDLDVRWRWSRTGTTSKRRKPTSTIKAIHRRETVDGIAAGSRAATPESETVTRVTVTHRYTVPRRWRAGAPP